MNIRRKRICSLVDRLLKQHQIVSPPVPVDQIARSHGLDVRRAPANEELSGFLYRDRRRNTASIGVNSAHSVSRQRFAISHELGHYLLHEQLHLHVDKQFPITIANSQAKHVSSDEDKEATLFAAELLMPEEMLKADLASLERIDLESEATIVQLAARYAVSVQALQFRIALLGLVTI